MKPLAIDLFCGLGGWTEGLLAEGYHVIGFDIERHVYGDHAYPAQLVVQDVLTLHGSQFKDAALIVASPPCQEYSYMAMPWTIAKEKAVKIRADETGAELERLNRLFNACFRIQREACEAAGRHIPLVVENVRGAIPWVGRSRWNYGSFHLWGDVPALMPPTKRVAKVAQCRGWHDPGPGHGRRRRYELKDDEGYWIDFNASREDSGFKSQGLNWSDREKRGQDFTRVAGAQAMEGVNGIGPNWSEVQAGKSSGHWTNPLELDDSHKLGGSWFHGYRKGQGPRNHGSKSSARKMASAMIAKIPLPLSRHIARTYFPTEIVREAAE